MFRGYFLKTIKQLLSYWTFVHRLKKIKVGILVLTVTRAYQNVYSFHLQHFTFPPTAVGKKYFHPPLYHIKFSLCLLQFPSVIFTRISKLWETSINVPFSLTVPVQVRKMENVHFYLRSFSSIIWLLVIIWLPHC